mmetsp:Transcript_24824/g.17530  ORF Transcript_24824/g.17530 Transcript_24824/m.17530 type:complete len:124 (+) Transcript_24824:267-638(+)|eukprot:CAMPEP_0116878446 /NCGR_PEP_ID=MMETSP0463-20121206/10206_1 /TAXON_ID=181622 /ORGANISM="Strombidinopsis sp, Strain SopsisLIS2011" /LENGTH=123 /DNA_ID=CAMNT_0004526695 /DNA_START=262 /DNA_END=633 /DNA_ORIENTATION=+
MIQENDQDALLREKIPLKLLRLTDTAQDGFLLVDYPQTVEHAALLEEYKGGMNSFVHVGVEDKVLLDIDANRVVCADCDKVFLQENIIDPEANVYLESYMPEDGCVYDCKSRGLKLDSDPAGV